MTRRRRSIVVCVYEGPPSVLDAEIEATWKRLRELVYRRALLRRSGARFGHAVSPATREKISRAKLGWNPTAATRARMSVAQRKRYARAAA